MRIRIILILMFVIPFVETYFREHKIVPRDEKVAGVVIHTTEAKTNATGLNPAPQTVEERIIEASKGTGWTEILLKLAKCESNYDEFAVNVNAGKSVDLGVLQWNMHYQKDFITPECALNVECSIDKFLEKTKANPNALSLWVCGNMI